MEIGRAHIRRTSEPRSSLDQCIEILQPSPFWTSLPCRENELLHVHSFVQKAFRTEEPKLFCISGEKDTGKTSAARLCAMMSAYENQIIFVDYEQLEYDDDPQWCETRRLVILDNAHKEQIREIVTYFFAQNCSVIVITRELLPMDLLSDLLLSTIRFSSYDTSTIATILRDKMFDVIDAINVDAIKYIAHRAVKAGDGVTGALRLLYTSLHHARTEEKQVLDMESAQACAEDPDLEIECPF